VVNYTRDSGKTWYEKEVPISTEAMQMNIRPLRDGSYIAFYRASTLGRQHSHIFTVPGRKSLPNSNSSICFEILLDRQLIIQGCLQELAA
jgi:hypothetical protein